MVTLGSLGCIAFKRVHKAHQAPAFQIAAIDTLCAGDAFASGFCIAYIRNKSINEALRYGNACGALMAAHLGVLAALPTQTILDSFLTQAST